MRKTQVVPEFPEVVSVVFSTEITSYSENVTAHANAIIF